MTSKGWILIPVLPVVLLSCSVWHTAQQACVRNAMAKFFQRSTEDEACDLDDDLLGDIDRAREKELFARRVNANLWSFLIAYTGSYVCCSAVSYVKRLK